MTILATHSSTQGPRLTAGVCVNNVPLENNNLGEGGAIFEGTLYTMTTLASHLCMFTSNLFLTFLLQVVTHLKELQDSQELVKQLQTQLDQQVRYLAEGVASFPDHPPPFWEWPGNEATEAI